VDTFFHDGRLLLLFDVTLDALHGFGCDRAHVVSHVWHSDGLQQGHERLVV